MDRLCYENNGKKGGKMYIACNGIWFYLVLYCTSDCIIYRKTFIKDHCSMHFIYIINTCN